MKLRKSITRVLIGGLCSLVLLVACGGRIDNTPTQDQLSLAHDAGSSPSLQDSGNATDSSDSSSPGADTSTPHDAVSDAPVDPALAPCLVGGNVFHVQAGPTDPIYPSDGALLSSGGRWTGTAFSGIPFIEIFNGGSSPSWWFEFIVPSGTAIHAGTYDPVVGPSPSHTNAGMRIGVEGRWCDQFTGRATITELKTSGNVDDPNLVSITASFEQTCVGTPTPMRGCIHFAQ